MNVKPMMKKLMNWIQGLFGGSTRKVEARSVLAMLAMTHDQELTCDEVQAMIDQFAEMQQRGEDPSSLFPLVKRHLDMCPDCREEYEALLVALQVNQS